MIDYAYEYGCCLACEYAEPGCLCYACKCSKCEHYIAPEDWDGEKGKCSLCILTKEQKVNWAKRNAIEADKKIKMPDDSRKLFVPHTNFKKPFEEGFIKIDK